MKNMKVSHGNLNGFTLVEMAVVIVILGLVLATLFSPLSAQRDMKNYIGTQSSISQIKEAINGFVLVNGRLPCPAKAIADPTNASYGLEDLSLCGQEGMVPWRTLGVPEVDEWGTHRMQTTDPWLGYWKFRVDSSYTNASTFPTNMMAASPTYSANLVVKDSSGNDITPTATGSEKPIAIIFSTGKNLTADGQNAGTPDNVYQSDVISGNFDDILVWITRPALLSKLVSAGKLP